MGSVAIIDYGLSNLDSVRRALEKLSARPYVASHAGDLGTPDRIVLPGVGALPDAMENLVARGFDTALAEQVDDGVPLLGICLGMQLLATKGTEGTPTSGLGWIPGEIVRIEAPDPDTRVPHVGWNEVVPAANGPLFDQVPEASDFYFVHSFHFVPDDAASIAATTPYAGGLVSAVQGGGESNVFGVQFHPEKSQTAGFRVLANFLEL